MTGATEKNSGNIANDIPATMRGIVIREPGPPDVLQPQDLHIFDPFKFKSPAWDLRQFWNLQRPWHPVYEGREVLNYAHLFKVLYILNIISAIAWLTYPYLQKAFSRRPGELGKNEEAQTYQLPKIDLALMTIAGLTIYMAICSC